MIDKFLHQRPGRVLDERFDTAPSVDSGAVDDFHSFGWMRGVRDRAIMLELRKKSGDVLAVGYGWIERAEFNPTDGISLLANGQQIRIKGRNLNAEARPEIRLFQGITRHRVAWIQEADRAVASMGASGQQSSGKSFGETDSKLVTSGTWADNRCLVPQIHKPTFRVSR